jgi:hypothetical protein
MCIMFLIIAENKTMETKLLLLGMCHSTRVIYERFGASETGDQEHELWRWFHEQRNCVAHAPILSALNSNSRINAH